MRVLANPMPCSQGDTDELCCCVLLALLCFKRFSKAHLFSQRNLVRMAFEYLREELEDTQIDSHLTREGNPLLSSSPKICMSA